MEIQEVQKKQIYGEIDCIINTRTKDDGVYYLVKFKGQ
jgi:hypothetical protein